MGKQYKIMLDPGHGGGDPGAIGPMGLKEKDVNLKVTNQLGIRLAKLGFAVFYTRTTDKRIVEDVPKDLAARCDRANNYKVDYYLSVHCNSLTASSKGTETYVYKKGGEAEKLANVVQRELVNELKLSDRGVKEGNLAVLRGTNMPAILVEIAFISNPTEEKLLKDDQVIARVVESLARGLCKYTGVTYIPPTTENKPPDGGTVVSGDQPSSWAKEAWQWAIDNKITDGTRPIASITREEVVALLYKYDKFKNKG